MNSIVKCTTTNLRTDVLLELQKRIEWGCDVFQALEDCVPNDSSFNQITMYCKMAEYSKYKGQRIEYELAQGEKNPPNDALKL